MFENLSDRLEGVFKKLRGHGKLSEENIAEAMSEVRKALLEADVNFKVAKKFVATVAEKAVGRDVSKSLSPGQQVIKIVHDELVELLGGVTKQIELDGRQPVTIMMAGLQGSGKTTTTGKLAKLLKAKGRYFDNCSRKFVHPIFHFYNFNAPGCTKHSLFWRRKAL